MGGAGEPDDLAAVQADDELIDALATGMFDSTRIVDNYHHYGVEDRVIAMLAVWKAEVDAEPLPRRVTVDAAAAAATAASAAHPVSGRARHLASLAGAAVLIVLAVVGVSVGAHSARPGTPLWGVSRVLYSEHARSVEAATEVAGHLELVRAALGSGQTEVAARELAAAAPMLGAVAPGDGVTPLAQQQQFLTAKLAETPPGTPTDPNAPLKDGQPAPNSAFAGATSAVARPGSTSPGPSTAPGSTPGQAPSPSTTPSVNPRILIAPTPTPTATPSMSAPPTAPRGTAVPPKSTTEGSPGPGTLSASPTATVPPPPHTTPAAAATGTTTTTTRTAPSPR